MEICNAKNSSLDRNGIEANNVKLNISNCNIHDNGSGIKINTVEHCTINNCNIYNNIGRGGIQCTNAITALTLIDSKIYKNSAYCGGGINFKGTSITLNNTIIGDNTKTTLANSSDNCSNYASNLGGGIYFDSNGSPQDITLTFINNSSICYNYDNTNLVSGNRYAGAGIYAKDEVNLKIINANLQYNSTNTSLSGKYLSNGIYAKNVKFAGSLNLGQYQDLYITSMDLSELTSITNSNDINVEFTGGGQMNNGIQIGSNCASAELSSKFKSNNSNYYLFHELNSSNKYNIRIITTTHVIKSSSTGTSSKSKLQTVIDKSTSEGFQSINPWIIIFDSDITEDPSYSYTNGSISSPAIFPSTKKYIIYGNGHTYNANRSSINAGSALFLKSNAQVEIYDLKITKGLNGTGGGIYVKSGAQLTLSGSTEITGNNANNGAGIFNEGTVTINDGVKITNNEATGNCGAIICENGATLNIGGATITGNKSTGTPGIYMAEGSVFKRLGTSEQLIMNNNQNTASNPNKKIGLDIQFENLPKTAIGQIKNLKLSSSRNYTTMYFVNLFIENAWLDTDNGLSQNTVISTTIDINALGLGNVSNTKIDLIGWKNPNEENNYYYATYITSDDISSMLSALGEFLNAYGW